MAQSLRLRLESLEARDCPAVSVTQGANGLLRIVGTSDWEQVQIVQNDAADTLYVYTNNLPKDGEVVTQIVDIYEFKSSAIRSISVNLKDGNDVLCYSLEAGTDLLFAKALSVNTGAGNDSVAVNLANIIMYWQADADTELTLSEGDEGEPIAEFPTEEGVDPEIYEMDGPSILPGPPAHSHLTKNFTLKLVTGAGDDHVNIDVGEVDAGAKVTITAELGADQDIFWLNSTPPVAEGGVLRINADGQSGNDNLYSMIYGDVAGRAEVVLRGGSGNDLTEVLHDGVLTGVLVVKAAGGWGDDYVAITANCRTESTGRLRAQAYGEFGDDRFAYNLGSLDQGAQIVNSLLHGGWGFDEGNCSRRVPTFSIEKLNA
jgi:hypothetical protein